MASLSLIGTKGAASSGVRFPLMAANSVKTQFTMGSMDTVFNTATAGSEDCEIQFRVNNAGTFTTALKLNSTQAKFAAGADVAVSPGGLATTATKGFLFIPSCAGAPTGTPANTYTNCVPLIYDRTNDKIYVRNTTWIKTAALT